MLKLTSYLDSIDCVQTPEQRLLPWAELKVATFGITLTYRIIRLSARSGRSITNWRLLNLQYTLNMDLSTALSSQKRLLVDLPQSPQPNKQKTLSTFVDKESQQQVYAELAAVDRNHSQERKESSPATLHSWGSIFQFCWRAISWPSPSWQDWYISSTLRLLEPAVHELSSWEF